MLRLTAVYAFILLSILLISVSFLLHKMKQISAPPQNSTEYIYIYVSEEMSDRDAHTESDTEASGWIMKEYRGRIGIFSTDGVLLQELDTYVKTLPEADRKLLGEGIYIETRTKLNALIEDYTE